MKLQKEQAEKNEKIKSDNKDSMMVTSYHLNLKKIKYKMTQITASDVNKLRKQTGAGMMDCKNALVEAKGDFEVAIDVLRKKGQKVASKRSDRSATEGVVLSAVSDDKKFGAMVSINCETDFVAKMKILSHLPNQFWKQQYQIK